MKTHDRKKVHAVLFLVAVMACLAGCSPVSEYIDQGKQYADSGDWDNSVNYYQKALEEYPASTEIKLMLAKSKWRAFMAHFLAGESLLKSGDYDNAILELKQSRLYDSSNPKPAQLIKKAEDMKRSDAQLAKGREFLKVRKFIQARRAFEKALEHYPDNEAAKDYLTHFKRKPSRYSGKLKHLKLASDEPISLKFRETPISNVFEVLSRLSGLNFIFDKDLKESKVTLFMTDVPFSRFIEVLLKTNKLAAKLINQKTVIIYPNTIEKNKQYEDLQIKTFYLANIDAKKTIEMLKKILKIKDITLNEKLNAIVIRGPEDVIKIASKIVEANDQPQPEVLLNVEILEVSRTKERQLGIDYNPSSMSLGVGEASPDIGDSASFSGTASLNALKRISSKELLLSLPTATLNMLKQDGDTRTLANPQIRVKNKEKSKIHIGERIPLRTNRRIDTTGVVTFDYQYQDIGVKLDAMPDIDRNGEITLNLNLEVSALGPNVGTSEDPQYSILTRTARSVLTIPEGEAVVIGGLIRDEERDSTRKLPFLGDLPMVGKLFSSSNSDASETDIMMAITPILIRSQNIPDDDVALIWSGNEDDFSMDEPYDSYLDRRPDYRNKPDKDLLKELERPGP